MPTDPQTTDRVPVSWTINLSMWICLFFGGYEFSTWVHGNIDTVSKTYWMPVVLFIGNTLVGTFWLWKTRRG